MITPKRKKNNAKALILCIAAVIFFFAANTKEIKAEHVCDFAIYHDNGHWTEIYVDYIDTVGNIKVLFFDYPAVVKQPCMDLFSLPTVNVTISKFQPVKQIELGGQRDIALLDVLDNEIFNKSEELMTLNIYEIASGKLIKSDIISANSTYLVDLNDNIPYYLQLLQNQQIIWHTIAINNYFHKQLIQGGK